MARDWRVVATLALAEDGTLFTTSLLPMALSTLCDDRCVLDPATSRDAERVRATYAPDLRVARWRKGRKGCTRTECPASWLTSTPSCAASKEVGRSGDTASRPPPGHEAGPRERVAVGEWVVLVLASGSPVRTRNEMQLTGASRCQGL